ncbi:MAG: ABC transporter ATP-binding protein [bacterium]|nr:ABC transporter ATP-binding protein [bacterium]
MSTNSGSSEDRKSSKNLRKLLGFVKPYKKRLLLAMLITVFLTMVGMIPPLITMYIVDSVIVSGQWDILEALLFVSIMIPVLTAGLRITNTYTINYISHMLIMDIRMAMYRHIFSLSTKFHDEMGVGKIMSRAMGDVATVRSMVTMRMLRIVTDIVSFFAAMAICYNLNWQMGLLLSVLIPLYVINYYGFIGGIRSSRRQWRRKMDEVSVGLQERLGGVQLVKAYGKERRENRAFTADTRESLDYAMQTETYRASARAGFWAVSGLRNTLVFCLGCYYVIQGEMTYGGVMAFLSYAMRVFEPVLNLMDVGMMYEQMMISVDRIYEVLDYEADITDKPNAPVLPPIQGHVKFDHVHFEYIAGEPVLKDVCLEVQPGQMVALVGHTGCGKTTLTSLLMRYFDVKSGSISVDGYDIRDVKLDSLRRQLGQVLQDSVLFNMSLRDNLRYGRRDAPMAEVIEAARVGEIHEFIMRTADGYDTKVGDDGIKLSVGEKQRLAIARAVLTNPRVMILDEATSSLDSLSEALIQKAMANVLKGRTSFVIAHRLSTIVNADLIVVMDQGEIVEKGSHEELLEKPDGKYRQLYEQQFAGQEQAELVAD